MEAERQNINVKITYPEGGDPTDEEWAEISLFVAETLNEYYSSRFSITVYWEEIEVEA